MCVCVCVCVCVCGLQKRWLGSWSWVVHGWSPGHRAKVQIAEQYWGVFSKYTQPWVVLGASCVAVLPWISLSLQSLCFSKYTEQQVVKPHQSDSLTRRRTAWRGIDVIQQRAWGGNQHVQPPVRWWAVSQSPAGGATEHNELLTLDSAGGWTHVNVSSSLFDLMRSRRKQKRLQRWEQLVL